MSLTEDRHLNLLVAWIVIALAPAAVEANARADSLIAHWKLDEAAGSRVEDSAAQNNGNVVGSIGWSPFAGRLDGAASFDGESGYVDCGQDPVFDLTDAITVAAWVKLDIIDKDWQAIVSKGDSAWRISTNESARSLHFSITGGPVYQQVNGLTELQPGQWHHVAATYDGKHLKIYMDGVQDADPVSYSGGIATNSHPVYIGENAERPDRIWNGMLDDIRIYDYALTAAEIAQLYDAAPIYVDSDAPGNSTGQSWFDACRTLQQALNLAQPGRVIHLGAGTYKPDAGSNFSKRDRTASFKLKDGLVLRGGFAGFGNPTPDLRDIAVYETVLSGDLAANDSKFSEPEDAVHHATRADNSRHVVTALDIVDAVLDGLTISGGHADGTDGQYPHINNGGGIYAENASFEVVGCSFSQNTAVLYDSEYGGLGAAIYAENCNFAVRDCSFSENATDARGSVFVSSSQFGVHRSSFNNNSGVALAAVESSTGSIEGTQFFANSGGFGGAIVFVDCEPDVRRCRFLSNTALRDGGAINLGYSNPEITSCLFVANVAQLQYGGAISAYASSPAVINCTFSENTAAVGGGAIHGRRDASPSVVNSILWGNTASGGGDEIGLTSHQAGGSEPAGSSATIRFSNINGGREGVFVDSGCTLYWDEPSNIAADPEFSDPNGPDGISGTTDDDLRLACGSPCMDTGENAALTGQMSVDLSGNARILNGRVDMGAYETRPVFHVDADAKGLNNGSTWADAFTSLQDALAAAVEVDLIRVAAGTYKPDRGKTFSRGDRSAAFQIPAGITLEGGYAGFGHADPQKRDPQLYTTILSGDLAGNDGPSFVNYSENSYHVVAVQNAGASTILDGFTVRGGNADGEQSDGLGGGIYIEEADPVVRNCIFTKNKARIGGATHIDGSVAFSECDFSANTALSGGAVHNSGGSVFERCTFGANFAGRGGAVDDVGNAKLLSCSFIANVSTPATADDGGGAVYTQGRSTITNCLFNGNSAEAKGGAIWAWYPDMRITNCTFASNVAPRGPAIVCYSEVGTPPGILAIANSIISNAEHPISIMDGSELLASYSNISDVISGPGNIEADSAFVDPDGPDNIPGNRDDDLRLSRSSPCLNSGSNDSLPVSIHWDLDGNPRIMHAVVDMGCYEFQDSFTWYVNGATGSDDNDGLTPENALKTIQAGIDAAANGFTVAVFPGVYDEPITFSGKSVTLTGIEDAPVIETPGEYGISFFFAENRKSVVQNFVISNCELGIFVSGGSPTIRNVTFADNGFGVAAYAGADPNISNCIFWGNSGGDLHDCSVRFSCLQTIQPGVGNISEDPLFAAPDAGDYHLKSRRGRYQPASDRWVLDSETSPCIDAAHPGEDAGAERAPHGWRRNMGAYGGTNYASLSDHRIPGDVNYDGLVNMLDVALVAENWLTQAAWAIPR